MPEYAVDDVEDRFNSRVIKSVVTPRPIAWVSTTGEDGVDNLAPYSTYNYISSANPVVMFNSPNPDHGGYKDSARNAIEREEFAVNLASEDLIEPMDMSSADIDPDESEFEFTELEAARCTTIDAPYVAAAAAVLECTLYDYHEIHDRVMVLGEVQHMHLDDRILDADGEVDMAKVKSVGRLGGPYYTVSEIHDYERQY
ncbi:MAG: flavin reductase family protein [Salinirussus sp.]